MPNPPPPARTASSRSAGCAAVRWAFALLLLCIGLQAVLLPAQRTAGQAHFHRAGHDASDDADRHIHTEAAGHDGERGPPPHRLAGDEGDHASALQTAAHHHHSAVDHHDHADEPHDVVYVDEGGAEPGSTPMHGLKRMAGDADGLLPGRSCSLADAPTRVPPPGRAPSHASQVVSPMERPPRHTA